MPSTCALGCGVTDVTMHRFPNPDKFPERFNTWVKLVGGKLETPSDYESYKNKTICDIHFGEEVRNRNNRLNALAVPTLNLSSTSRAHHAETAIGTVSPRGDSMGPKAERQNDPQHSFADAVKADLMVAVAAEGTGHLSPQQTVEVQELLQERVMQEAMQLSADQAGPTFRGKPVHAKGVLKLWCEDQRTLTWLILCVDSLTLSTGKRLKVKKQSELPQRVRCGILLPGVWKDMVSVKRTLKYQNPWSEVGKWLLVKAVKQQTETFVVASIPEEVVQPLMQHGRRLGFLLGSVYVKFQGARGKFLEEPPSLSVDIQPAGDCSGRLG